MSEFLAVTMYRVLADFVAVIVEPFGERTIICKPAVDDALVEFGADLLGMRSIFERGAIDL
jgi:hypothetical protein